MKTLLFTLLIVLQAAALEVAVSVVPQQTFVQKIGGDRVHVTVMVPLGSSPHSYEPKSADMKALSKAALYFAVGIEFEEAWLGRFGDANPKMSIIRTDAGIEKMEAHHEAAHDDHDHGTHDPHIWTSPANVRIMAHTIADALIKADEAGAAQYKAGLEAFLREIDATDETIRAALKQTPKGAKFMVFHPAWGYFARDYGLIQLAMEVEGKEPKPKALMQLIETAKKEHIHAIITQKEFSDRSARALADALGIDVRHFSPLHSDWSHNLTQLAQTIAR
ncbi:MAG: zinc ABC transporter substrate-binding protein [Campylobacterales bacterium]|nr:zinc ABC transporter substrate-binding protein [Campylobacterales bacterium]